MPPQPINAILTEADILLSSEFAGTGGTPKRALETGRNYNVFLCRRSAVEAGVQGLSERPARALHIGLAGTFIYSSPAVLSEAEG
jgi:hypothetical protein